MINVVAVKHQPTHLLKKNKQVTSDYAITDS